MNPSTRIPPLLQPYVRLPRDDSLLLVTSTLGASANWLLIRFLCDALSNNNNNNNTQDDEADQGHNVVLISWMRDYDFWRQEARKGAGLDLERLKRGKRFAFVDGLSGLVMGEEARDADADADAQTKQSPSRPVSSVPPRPQQQQPQTVPVDAPPRTGNILPVRGPPARTTPARGPPAPPAQPRRPTNTIVPVSAPQHNTPGHSTLTSLSPSHLATTLSSALTSLSSPSDTPSTLKTLVILDAPDAYLALSSTPPSALLSTILHLHAHPSVSHILTHMHADTPLLTPSAPAQPLETTQFNLVTKMAHISARVLGTRVLDTGVARDVSGVVRVTGQSVGWAGLGMEEGGGEGDLEGTGREFLYRVMGDGSVKVFERGAGGEG